MFDIQSPEICKPRRFKLYCPTVDIGDECLKYVDTFKYLGFVFSENIKDDANMLTLYDQGGGALKAPPPIRFFALAHLILELHYCTLGTFPKK